jgi:hypothetical protein
MLGQLCSHRLVGLGYWILIPKIAGSNPAGSTPITLVVKFSYHMSLWHFQKKNHLYHSVLSHDDLVPHRGDLVLLFRVRVLLVHEYVLQVRESAHQAREFVLL